MLLLALLAGVLHRPLLHGLIGFVVPRWAAGQGLQVALRSTGSIWSDLSLSGVRVSGGDEHWLSQVEVAKVGATYDWRALWRGDWERAVRAVTLHEAEVRLDLRRRPAGSSKAGAKPKSLTGNAPPLVWPEAIEIEDINAEVTLADGSLVRASGLRLRQPAQGEGELAWTELAWVPAVSGSAAVLFPPARARLERRGRQLLINRLDLPYEARLEEVTLDLDHYDEGVAALALEMVRASARLRVAATARDLGQGPLSLEVESSLQGLQAQELAALPLPAGWSLGSLAWQFKASGRPADWASMTAELELTAQGLELAGLARLDEALLPLRLREGKLVIEEAVVRRVDNELRWRGSIEQGGKGGEITQAVWQAEVEADLPTPAALFVSPPDFGGAARARVKVHGRGARVEGAALSLSGADWTLAGYRLPEPRLEAELAGERLRVTLPESRLGEGNTFSAEAALSLSGSLPLEASWQVQCDSLPNLLAATGVPAPPQPIGAAMRLEGKAQADLTALLEGDFSKAQAQTRLTAREWRLQADDSEGAPSLLESLELDLNLKEGVARLERGLLRLDAENEVTLSGQAGLAGARAFEIGARMRLPRLAAMEPLLRPFAKVVPGAGELEVEARARGELSPWQCDGWVKLAAREVALPGLPERMSVEAGALFAGTRADITKLSVGAGPWSAQLRAEIGPEKLSVEDLQVRLEETLLAEGRLRYPWDWLAEPEPDQAGGGPLEWRLRVEDLALAELLGALGVKGVPEGKMNVDARVDGRPQSLEGAVTASFAAAAPLVAGLEPPVLKAELTLEAERLALVAEARQAPLETLTVAASLPLAVAEILRNPAGFLEQPVEAKLRLPESRLDALAGLAGDWVRELPARLRLEAHLTGTLARPSLQAEVDLDCAEVLLAQPDLPSLRDLVLRVRARDQEVRLEELSMLLAGGRLRASGRAGTASLLNPEIDLELSAEEALLFRDANTSLRADASLRLQGPLDAARLGGKVELVRGRYYKDIDLAPALRLPSDAPALPPDPGRVRTQLELPAFLAGWQFAVDVVTRDPILLSGNLINGALSVRAALGGSGEAPLLTGGAKVERLLLKLPFSRLKVTHGAVTLRPEHPFDPQVDLRAESRMPTHHLTLFASGPISDVKTRFSSTPPLSEADIAALLATGTTLSGDGSQAAAEAVVRGLYLYLSEFYRKTFNKKKVIDETPPRFHFGFAPSGVGADRAMEAMQATYDFNDRWRLSGQFAPSGRVRAALGYLIRFGKNRSNPSPEALEP